MSLRDRALGLLLWYAVLAWATWMGGTLYQMVVVVPLWSASPPESVWAFFNETEYNRTIFHFFGPPFMAARALPLLLAVALAWHRPAHRFPLLIAALSVALATIFTVAYVYPINAVLFAQAGGSGSPEQITAMVSQWIWADRVRFGVGVLAFLCLLWAFRLPLHR